MSADEFQAVIKALTPEQMADLEWIRCSVSREKFKARPLELIKWSTDPNLPVLYSSNVDQKQHIIGSRYYGMWVTNSYNKGYHLQNYYYSVPMFNRIGPETNHYDDWSADIIEGDVGANLNLPYSDTGILVIIKDANKAVHRLAIQVVSQGEQPVTVSKYPMGSGVGRPMHFPERHPPSV